MKLCGYFFDLHDGRPILAHDTDGDLLNLLLCLGRLTALLNLSAQTCTVVTFLGKVTRTLLECCTPIGEFLFFLCVVFALAAEYGKCARNGFCRKGTLVTLEFFLIVCEIGLVFCELSLTLTQPFDAAVLVDVLGDLDDALIGEHFFFRLGKFGCLHAHLFVGVLLCMAQHRRCIVERQREIIAHEGVLVRHGESGAHLIKTASCFLNELTVCLQCFHVTCFWQLVPEEIFVDAFLDVFMCAAFAEFL